MSYISQTAWCEFDPDRPIKNGSISQSFYKFSQSIGRSVDQSANSSRDRSAIAFFVCLFQKSFGKGHFLVFSGCEMEGFAAIEECPMTSRPIGPDGGKLLTQVDTNVEAFVPPGIMSKSTEVKMLVWQ